MDAAGRSFGDKNNSRSPYDPPNDVLGLIGSNRLFLDNPSTANLTDYRVNRTNAAIQLPVHCGTNQVRKKDHVQSTCKKDRSDWKKDRPVPEDSEEDAKPNNDDGQSNECDAYPRVGSLDDFIRVYERMVEALLLGGASSFRRLFFLCHNEPILQGD